MIELMKAEIVVILKYKIIFASAVMVAAFLVRSQAIHIRKNASSGPERTLRCTKSGSANVIGSATFGRKRILSTTVSYGHPGGFE